MARSTFEVANYRIVMAQEMGVDRGSASVYAYITCVGPTGERFTIYFLRPDSGRAGNVYNPEEKWASSFVPAEQFPWYLDVLRNEKPVFCLVDSQRPQWNRISTGPEPTGEGPTDAGAVANPAAPPARPAQGGQARVR